MPILIYLLLVFEILLFTLIEKRLYGSWLTPFSVLAIPYLSILTLILCFGSIFGLNPFYYPSLWVWIIGLAVFWIFGNFATRLAFGNQIPKHHRIPMKGEECNEHMLAVLSIICVVISAISLRNATAGFGFFAISTPEFKDIYGVGWAAHFRVISYSILMYYVGTKKYTKWINAILLLLIFAFIAIGTGKSWLMIPLLTGIMYQMVTNKFKINITRVSQVALSMFVIFNLAYLIRFASDGNYELGGLEIYEFLFKHFFNYLSSGIMGLSEQCKIGLTIPDADWQVIFAPIINLKNLLTGSKMISGVTEYWISTGINMESNVHTIFGTLCIHLGVLGSLIYVAFMSVIIYLFYGFALIKRNSWVLLAAIFELSILAFGWFDNYSGNLAIIEVPGWTLAFMLVCDGRSSRFFRHFKISKTNIQSI